MTPRQEMLVVAAGRVGSALLALASFAVFTRLLPPGEYALLVLLMAFSSFAGLILINPAVQWLLRHLHEWYDAGRLAQHLKENTIYYVIAGLVLGLSAGVWYGFVVSGSAGKVLGVAMALAAYIAFAMIAQTLAGVLNALGHRLQGALWQVAGAGLPLVGGALFAVVQAQAVYWLVGQATGAAVAAMGTFLAARRILAESTGGMRKLQSASGSPFYSEPDFWRFALPATGVTAFQWLEGNGYRFLLERSWDATALGLFFLALSIPAQMTGVMESYMIQYAYPYFFRNLAGQAGKGRQSEVTTAMTNTLLPLYWAWSGFLLLMAPQFLYLFAGPAYHGASQWLAFGCLLEAARLTGNAWLVAAQATKNFHPMLLPFGWGAAGSLAVAAGTVWLGLSPGTFAAGLVGVAVVKAAWVAVQARRMLDVRLAWKRPAAAAAIFVVVFLGFDFLGRDHGPLAAFAILVVAGLGAVTVGYAHLRTSSAFQTLSSVKLG
jgi:O-antigen/teichoic acid export membrane protein